MTRRTRAAVFLVLAAGSAGLAAAIADGYGASLAESFGPLRPVVVARSQLQAGKPIEPGVAAQALEVRRVPTRFVPRGALVLPEAALGRSPAAVIPAGSYLLAAQLQVPDATDAGGSPMLESGRRPVEIAVSGGEALFAAGASPRGSRVDVVVTTEPRGIGRGRTYIAAAGVELLALAKREPVGPGPASGWSATLALTRSQALRLIEAESFARGVRLLPRPTGR
jgi:Flp pilus assembly protein CpaB